MTMTQRSNGTNYVDVRPGWTLVETLVAIGVIGVLISIIVPALMGARAAGGQAVSLSNCRQIAQSIDSYAQTKADRYPVMRADVFYQGTPADPRAGLAISDPVMARWHTRHHWWAVMADVIDPAKNWQTWVSPGSNATAENLALPDYYFSNSFVGAPALWRPNYQLGDDSVLRDVRRAEVRFPSRKAMIWDAAMRYLPRPERVAGRIASIPMPIGFADMHAETKPFADAKPPHPNPLNNEGWADAPLHNTPEGVEGYDY